MSSVPIKKLVKEEDVIVMVTKTTDDLEKKELHIANILKRDQFGVLSMLEIKKLPANEKDTLEVPMACAEYEV